MREEDSERVAKIYSGIQALGDKMDEEDDLAPHVWELENDVFWLVELVYKYESESKAYLREIEILTNRNTGE